VTQPRPLRDRRHYELYKLRVLSIPVTLVLMLVVWDTREPQVGSIPCRSKKPSKSVWRPTFTATC
jgi:hypothetical protein